MEINKFKEFLKRMKLLEAGPLEVHYKNERGEDETKPLYLGELIEGPIPQEYQDLYPPNLLPFAEFYTHLDRNYVPRSDLSNHQPLQIRIEDIIDIELLVREHLVNTFIKKRDSIPRFYPNSGIPI
ncbi:MAG: hypothetical protein AABX71_01935 [Nanoarchaeota archaeon]